MILSVVMLVTSCQEGYEIVNEPDENTAFSSNDSIADLILKVSLKDGSFDNLIDNCSAISIRFPYTVQVRSELISLSSIEDLENFKQEYSHLRNAINIQYPVTATLSDYSVTVLSNKGDLQRIQNQYNNHIEDDDIECIDFIYPLELNLYDTDFQKPDFIRVMNDRELHGILKTMNDLIIEISYPILMEIADGTRVSVQNNKELENEIRNAMGTCDEGDEIEIAAGEYESGSFNDTGTRKPNTI